MGSWFGTTRRWDRRLILHDERDTFDIQDYRLWNIDRSDSNYDRLHDLYIEFVMYIGEA